MVTTLTMQIVPTAREPVDDAERQFQRIEYVLHIRLIQEEVDQFVDVLPPATGTCVRQDEHSVLTTERLDDDLVRSLNLALPVVVAAAKCVTPDVHDLHPKR